MTLSMIRAAVGAAILVAATTSGFAQEQHSSDMQSSCDAMASASAEAVELNGLVIENAFARATLPNAPVGGGYLSITNTNSSDDVLVSAESAFADGVQLHQMSMVDDVMRMSELPDGIAIAAGETVTLAPGGLHMMFMKLTQSFDEGGQVPVTLSFRDAGTLDLMLDVRGIAAGSGSDCMEMHDGE